MTRNILITFHDNFPFWKNLMLKTHLAGKKIPWCNSEKTTRELLHLGNTGFLNSSLTRAEKKISKRRLGTLEKTKKPQTNKKQQNTCTQKTKPHDIVCAWVNALSNKIQPEKSVKSLPQSSSLPCCTCLQLEKELSCRNVTLLGWFPVHILQYWRHCNFDAQWDEKRMPSKTVKEILSTTFPKDLLCTSFNLSQALLIFCRNPPGHL